MLNKNSGSMVFDFTNETIALFSANDMEVTKQNVTFNSQNDETANAYWNRCLEIIKDNVDAQVFKTWFEPIKALKWEMNKLTVMVPSQWFFEWIEAHYYSLVQKTIQRVMGEDAHLLYEVIVEENKGAVTGRTIKLPGLKYPPAAEVAPDETGNKPTCNATLNPRYAFDNFIKGDCNQFACSAALAVSQNPGGTRFNPLIIYGDTGLGKTHLAQAIGNQVIRKNPKARVLYTNSEKFTMDFIHSVQTNKSQDFADTYRNVDVLIVDDIQFFAGKEKTQDNFFHTFNALHQEGKQIVLTSDKAPRDLADVDARLISRFQWGLTVDVQQPDFEMRMAILQRKSLDEGIELPQNVIEYLAKNVTSHVRELEGALISLIAKVSLDRRELNVDLAKEIVLGHCSLERPPLTIDLIKEIVGKHFKISVELMESKSRKHEIAVARQMSMYLAKQLTELSLKNIGGAFGGRDHSTVLHSCQAIENYLVTDRTIKASYELLMNKLKNR